MRLYELRFYAFDMNDETYTCERTWFIQSDESYESMLLYADELNEKLNIESENIFTIDEVYTFKGAPDIKDIIEDLKDM